MKQYKVEENEKGKRIDAYISQKEKELSLQEWLPFECILDASQTLILKEKK